MPNGAKNRRSLIFLSLALSTTGLLLTIALVSRSDYFTSSEPTKKPTHQYTNRVHSVKNFTAAAQLMEKMPTIHSPSDIKSQTPNFSAFNPINSSNSSNNSNNSVAKTNATAATLNHPPSDKKSEDPAQLPFGFSSNSRNIEDSTNSPSIADNTTAGNVASHTAESLIGSIMSPKTLLSTAMNEIGNSTVKSNFSKVDQIRLVSPHTATILLSNEVIPSKDYLYLYDSVVSKNITGQLVARLPCYSDMKSELLILAGNLSKLKPVNDDAKPIAQMSKPGFDCLYGLEISPHILLSQNSTGSNNVFNIALYNPSKNPIRLSPGTSVTVNLFDSLS